MSRRNRVLLAGGGLIVLVVVVWILLTMNSGGNSSDIPEVPHLQSLSGPVIEQIEEALAIAREEPSAQNLGRLGMVYHASANYEQAGICYQLAIGKSRSEWIWNYYYGILNMELGDPETVIENFRTVLEINPDVDLAWYYMGEEFRNVGDFLQAEEAFKKIAAPGMGISQNRDATRVDHFPLSVYARYQLARIYSETSRTDLAENTLKEILVANRTFGPAYRLMGSILSTGGDTLAGSHYVTRASDLMVYLAPVDTLSDKLVLLSRSEFYLPKKIDEAERTFYDQWTFRLVEQALRYMPENKYVISKAINNYLWMGMHEKAGALIERHIEYFRDDYNELTKTGLVFFVNRLYAQAEKYLTAAMVLKPEEASVQEELAMCYWALGEKEKAYVMMDALYEANSSNPDVLADMADILFFTFSDTRRADEMIGRLRRFSPSHPKGLKVQAGMAEKNGDYREAIALYDASFRGNPEELTTIRYLGNLLVKERMWERAIQHFRDALEFHPNDPDLIEKLGSLLTMCPDPSLRKTREGIEYLERAFIHMSSRPLTIMSAGRSLSLTLAQNGETRRAMRTIEQTLEIARYENISPAYKAELEEIYRTIRALEN
jgi:tetratricopeptide (TPR) repeat protein